MRLFIAATWLVLFSTPALAARPSAASSATLQQIIEGAPAAHPRPKSGAGYLHNTVRARIISARQSVQGVDEPGVERLRAGQIQTGKTYLAEGRVYLQKLAAAGPRVGKGRQAIHRGRVTTLRAALDAAERDLAEIEGSDAIAPYEIDVDGYERHLGQQARREFRLRLFGKGELPY